MTLFSGRDLVLIMELQFHLQDHLPSIPRVPVTWPRPMATRDFLGWCTVSFANYRFALSLTALATSLGFAQLRCLLFLPWLLQSFQEAPATTSYSFKFWTRDKYKKSDGQRRSILLILNILSWGQRCLHSRLNFHLRHCHPVWALIQVPAASFLIQRSADNLGKQQRMIQGLGPPYPFRRRG